MSLWNGPKRLIVIEGTHYVDMEVFGVITEVEVKHRFLHPDCPVFGKVIAGPFTDPDDIAEVQATCERWNANQLK